MFQFVICEAIFSRKEYISEYPAMQLSWYKGDQGSTRLTGLWTKKRLIEKKDSGSTKYYFFSKYHLKIES